MYGCDYVGMLEWFKLPEAISDRVIVFYSMVVCVSVRKRQREVEYVYQDFIVVF